MTDEQIIKAYEGLTPIQQLNLYRNLYYNDGYATERGVIANAINDILPEYERQKAEIERLTDLINEIAEANEDLVRDNHDLYVSQKKREEESAELEAEIDKQYEQAKADILGNMADGGTSCHWCISQHRAEAIKEFAERLFERVVVKTLVGKSEDYSDGFIEATCWYDEEIDNLVKEMTEEQP